MSKRQTRLVCADCGYQLRPLTRAQETWALRTGRIPRPPCPASAGGLHRVTDEALAGREASA